MSMFETAERVSAINSNFYVVESDISVQTNYQKNFPPVPQATSSYFPTTEFHFSGSRLPLTDPRSLEGGESSAAEDDRVEDSRDFTPMASLTPTSTEDALSKADSCVRATTVASIKENDDRSSKQTSGLSSAPYSAYRLPMSPTYAPSVPFDKIAFKMDMEELKARIQSMKTDVNHDDSMSGSFLRDVKHDSLGASLSNVGCRAHLQTDTSPFSQEPSRIAEKDPHTSCSSSPPLSSPARTQKTRRTRSLKQYQRRIPPSTEDGSQLVQASSLPTSGSSRALLGVVCGKGSPARFTPASSRSTAERGTRRGLTSRRGCFL